MPYTTGDLVRLVTNLQTDVDQILALIVCGSRVTTDAPAMAADMIFITKTMSALSTRLQTQVSDVRREARIILTLHAMGQATGASADPAAFIAKCHAEDLDYLVTLRKANRDPAWTAGFYLRCRETALGLDPDVMGEPDGDHDGPDVPGNLDPPKPVDYR